jgi:hypothetical protein
MCISGTIHVYFWYISCVFLVHFMCISDTFHVYFSQNLVNYCNLPPSVLVCSSTAPVSGFTEVCNPDACWELGVGGTDACWELGVSGRGNINILCSKDNIYKL